MNALGQIWPRSMTAMCPAPVGYNKRDVDIREGHAPAPRGIDVVHQHNGSRKMKALFFPDAQRWPACRLRNVSAMNSSKLTSWENSGPEIFDISSARRRPSLLEWGAAQLFKDTGLPIPAHGEKR